MTAPPVLALNCRFRYGEGFALDAAFTAEAGVTALFGPSGCGKTTSLMLIAGLLRPDAGSIALSGEMLVDRSSRTWLPAHRRDVGVVFQDHRLFPHKTVEANLRYGLTRTQRKTVAFDEVVDVLDLRDCLTRLPGTISGGQRQRVALGRALLRSPKLLLLDEPFEGLDQPLRERLTSYLQQIADRWQIPMLLVSHDQAVVRRLADRVVVLQAGSVADAGPTQGTLDRAMLADSATQEGPLNMLKLSAVAVQGDHLQGRVGDQSVYVPLGVTQRDTNAGDSGGALFVRFSPADVTLSRSDITGLSMRNHLVGRISDIIATPQRRLFVAVDVGQIIWAQITEQARAELDLKKGDAVTCLIKASSLHVV